MSSLLDRLANDNGDRANWIRAHFDFPHKDWCLIWPFARSDTGYALFGQPPRKVHRVMCEYRHGPAPTPEHHAAHSCDRGHEGCVNPWHLDWKTPSDNQYDRYKDGAPPRPRWKLTPEQAKEIRELKGLEHTKDTAARYGIRESNVRLIQSGKTWKKDRPDFRQWTDEEIKRIRSLPVGVKGLVKDVAKEFGVTDSTIYRIKNAKSYRHLDGGSLSLPRPTEPPPKAWQEAKAEVDEGWPDRSAVTRSDDKTWPDGCQDANSCANHMACMYKNCWHEWRDISSEVKSALALPRPQSGGVDG